MVIDLSDYNGSSIKFAFYGESTAAGGDNNIHVDNIVVEKIPTCFNPLSPKAIAYKNSAEISWVDDDRSAPVAWILQYKKAAEEAWATLNISENPYTLEGLEDYTAYDVRVAADCGGEDVSKYSKVVSFKTAAGVPYAESFVSMPADWNRFIGLYDDVAAGEPLVKATSGWTVAAGNGVYPDSAAHLKLQIAGDAVKNWIVSPAIMILKKFILNPMVHYNLLSRAIKMMISSISSLLLTEVRVGKSSKVGETVAMSLTKVFLVPQVDRPSRLISPSMPARA